MALTIKDSPELNSTGKPGGASQNSENKSGMSPRSNPVCLEVGVTIRSLPGEAGGLAQPIREEGRTVIVFDNGAVLRSANNLPAGQKVILSNASGRDVVCRVAAGHNLPSVKGYIEVEFIEPVSDFWGIHQDGPPISSTTPVAAPPAPRLAQTPPPSSPPVTSQASTSAEAPAKPASVSKGSGPTFEDIPGLVSTSTTVSARASKAEPAKPVPERMLKGVSDYSHSVNASPTSLANWDSPSAGHPAEVRAIPMTGEALPAASPSHAPARDFLSKGLMAYEKPSASSSGRTPLILGAAALVLAGVGTIVFVMHRKTAPSPMAKAAVVTQPSTPAPPAPIPAPAAESAEPPLEAAAQAAGEAAAQTKPQAQPAVEQAQTMAEVAPASAVVTGPATLDSRPETRPESRNVKRQDKSAVVNRQPDASSPRRPVIPNLKIGSPSAPNPRVANLGDGTAPMTEIASTEAVGAVPSAELLTSAGRTSNPPAPPTAFPSATAPAPAAAVKTIRDAKLISSTRPVYPATAKTSSVQGIVVVSASIDANGKVASAKALGGPLLLREAAVDSVKQWKYSPALVDGKPAPSQVTVNVEFRLN